MQPIVFPAVFPVTCHTDFVGPDSIFVAIQGYAENGIHYCKKAIEKGARTLVVDIHGVLSTELMQCITQYNVTVIRVPDTRQALADLSAQYAGFPAQKLTIFGITGTKGKTTTSFLLEHCLTSAGYKTALVSSVCNRILGVEFPSSLTTPQPDYLQQFLKLCVDNGVTYVVMEVAAQALTLHRVKNIEFDGVIFTNFSHEHLEFYTDLDDYFAAKCLILSHLKADRPLICNADDPYGQKILLKYSNAIGYSCISDDTSEISCTYESTHALSLMYTSKNGNIFSLENSILFGIYNVYNVVAAVSMLLELGIDRVVIQKAIRMFSGVPGRLQHSLLPNGARVFIDYAHNPESFRAVLSALRLLTNHLIVIFGAGGGRDKQKRPLMGAVASDIADIVILTSDNPRHEDPQAIIDDIQQGIKKDSTAHVSVFLDRKHAIELAYALSSSTSVIAILGKGVDTYQMIGSTKYYFNEQEIVSQLR